MLHLALVKYGFSPVDLGLWGAYWVMGIEIISVAGVGILSLIYEGNTQVCPVIMKKQWNKFKLKKKTNYV